RDRHPDGTPPRAVLEGHPAWPGRRGILIFPINPVGRFSMMKSKIRMRFPARLAALCLLLPLAARGEEPAANTSKPDPIPGVGLLDALRSGTVAVDTEGTGDGNMAITVANQTGRKLRVILPPGLVASGVSGQFGGMGGMGGGGMGGMMGGMGGM